MRYLVVYSILALLISMSAYAQEDPKPILYGQAFDGNGTADGAIVTVYPQGNSADNITDIVGEAGKTNVANYWKANLFNLVTDIQDNDIVAIHLTDGVKETLRLFAVDINVGTQYLLLNLNPAFNDYDEDGFFGDVDCDDNDAAINPNAEDVCGDSIDQDCSGSDASCEFEESIIMNQGWTLFSLAYNPASADNTEELGQSIINSGESANCEVVMWFNEDIQEMEDDILGLADPSVLLTSTEEYYIFCDNLINFTYGGTLWE